MKPREFDDLVRSKFDQNDFAYNPGNWDRLTEQMEQGRDKKRSMFVWLGLPLASMAASVALAMGVTTLLRQGMPERAQGPAAYVQAAAPARTSAVPQVLPQEPVKPADAGNRNDAKATARKSSTQVAAVQSSHNNADNNTIAQFHIKLQEKTSGNNGLAMQSTAAEKKVAVQNAAQPRKKITLVNEGYNTFREEEVKRAPKLSIILSGGVNYGNHNNGYSAGATVRRMINEKVYVEGDVAFAKSSNMQTMSYMEEAAPIVAMGKVGTAGAKVSSDEPVAVTPTAPPGIIRQKDVSYNLYYAQVTPSIGYKIMKRMSIGVGPDFQKALADNRPAPSTVERGTIQVAPLFDVGFMGKTEYAIAKQVKAAVYYRKGINNVLTPIGKYIDRDYVQFQVKCTIFNK
ncbi:MAG: hypothetical protein V4649_00940 [Bacteroidota bacterium]